MVRGDTLLTYFTVCVGSSRRENGQQGGSMRRSFSKSATDLLHPARSASGERAGDVSPRGSPPLDPRKDGGAEGERPRANTAATRPAPSFFSNLRNKFHRTLSKDSKSARRKDILLDGVRSNSHPDVSVERQDSTTDYAADYSSAEQSSSGTPLTMSPRRVPPVHPTRSSNSQDNPEVITEAEPEAKEVKEAGQDSSDTSGILGCSGGSMEGGGEQSGGSLLPGILSFTPPTTRFRLSSSLSKDAGDSDGSQQDPAVARQRALRQHAFYQLHVHLKRGEDLVARDACGTSDPYVKFKVQGKLVYKSKTVYKDLNPTWDETFTVGIEDPFEPITVKVFDYDWGLQDDFMGLASIDLTTLELDKSQDVVLPLSEVGKTSTNYGVLHLNLRLQPKTQEEKEQLALLADVLEKF